MKNVEFNKTKKDILDYCERNNLQFESCHIEKEVDFVMDFGMEAIDRETLENPTCINTEQYIMVYLPMVTDTHNRDWERSHNVYQNIVYGLMETAKPDYLLGAENGIVKAVMYCVWAE